MAPLDSVPDPAALPDISGDQPAGENLEFDPAFAELERLAQGKSEQQYGSTIVPAEEPDWKEVIASASALMQRTCDLRVMGRLAVARLQREGMGGYAETMAMICRVLETRWTAVHPQLDPEDDNDPTLRANALLGLAAPGRVMRFIRYMPLARSVRAGAVSWRDISVSTGVIEVEDGTPKMTESVIAAAFRETDGAALVALRAAVASAIASAAAIPAAFDENAGYGTGPDFTDLTKLLREITRMTDTYAQAAPEAAEADPGAEEAEAPEAIGSRPPSAATRAAPAMSIATMGPPTNRADALRLLDLVIEFYERSEPSSPLPLLIARARRLADKGFLDILRDMAPDGVSQAERIAGTPSTEF